jgi:hypothetical protein
MSTAVAAPRAIQPEFLGPLAERPLVETAPDDRADDLFPGSAGFLGARERRARLALWRSAAPLLERVLRRDEHVLHVARVIQVPPPLHSLGMGYMWMSYHQALLVVSDQRAIEVLLEPGGKTIGTRVRAYEWAGVKTLKVGFASLTLVPAIGKRQVWKLPVRGDRRLLKALLPRLQERLQREGAAAATPQPIWHCPACGAALPEKAPECHACRAVFRSPGVAAWLSVAFPGAGLLYSGHPVLALLDCLGEVALFGVLALAMAQAGNAEAVAGLVILGLVFGAMTKVQSVHLTRILTTRTRPDDAARRARFRALGKAGAALSVLAVAGVFLVAGRLAPALRHDLEVAEQPGAWSGSRSQTDWEFFADDDSARSQWTHESGPIVTVFAYPLDTAVARDSFRAEFGKVAAQDGQGTLVVEDDRVPAPHRGFRYVREQRGAGGEPLAAINYFVYDPNGNDVHQLFTVAAADERDRVETLVRDLLQRARWTDPVPPQR